MEILNNSLELIKNIRHNQVYNLKDVVAYKEGMVASLALAARDGVNMSLISFDKDEELATHAASGDAFVTILDGEADITVGGRMHHLQEGEALVMPSGIPHSLYAVTKFKMLLVVVK